MFLKVQYRWLLLQASASNYPFQQPGKVERQIPVYPLQQPLGFHGHSLLAVKQADSIFQGAVIVAQAAEHRLAQFRVRGILPAIALLHDNFPHGAFACRKLPLDGCEQLPPSLRCYCHSRHAFSVIQESLPPEVAHANVCIGHRASKLARGAGIIEHVVGEEQGIKFVLPGTAHKSLYAIHHYRHVEIPPALDLAAKLNLIKSLVALCSAHI